MLVRDSLSTTCPAPSTVVTFSSLSVVQVVTTYPSAASPLVVGRATVSTVGAWLQPAPAYDVVLPFVVAPDVDTDRFGYSEATADRSASAGLAEARAAGPEIFAVFSTTLTRLPLPSKTALTSVAGTRRPSTSWPIRTTVIPREAHEPLASSERAAAPTASSAR